MNPLCATVGGVAGPAAIYFVLNRLFGTPALANGWGIPTATDIAIAWLVARLVFGRNHGAVSFLLLLAIADDAIGLAIIAAFYPDPHLPVQPAWLLLTTSGTAIAWLLRRNRVQSYWWYLLLGGVPSWFGLRLAHLHPALALTVIVPFLPHPPMENRHLFEENLRDSSTLARFEHEWKVIVDCGMFLFGLTNAGVAFTGAGTVTWLVLTALVLGKGGGVFLFSLLAERAGFSLPVGMDRRHLLLAGLIAGIGFTVALFVAGEAFVDAASRDAAKVGAMLSVLVALPALALGRLLKVGRR